ncbi:MAG: leucine-rich repeat domain-containing protein [Ruminococcaceae bacterium]|nr:leucine-rich repeat domain-containing protein [Oscillospiraceae bacterium]
MKKQIVITSLSIILIITCLLAACAADANQSIFQQQNSQSSDIPKDTNTQATILALESRIQELLKNQNASSEEYSKELELLRAELEELKNSATSEALPPADTENNVPQAPRFLYTVENNEATITGYTGDDTHIVVPSAIDGYTVTKIAEKAFCSEKLKSVIITNGISRIDWFAFEGCTSLDSITIPASVTSIGYSAFASAPPSLTIYCHSGSFAQNYAKSYGLSYAII